MEANDHIGRELYEEHERTGLSYAEIARRRGINPNTARRLVWEYRRQSGKRGEDGALEAGDINSDIGIEELEEFAELSQLISEAADPVATHSRIRIDGQFVAILLAGCFHVGGRWTFHRQVREWLERALAHDFTHIGLFGDEIDNFIAGAKTGAWSSYMQALSPPVQRMLWEKWLDRIGHKVLWATTSQHGTLWDNMRGYSPVMDAYRRRGIRVYDVGYIDLEVGDLVYHIAISHSFPGHSIYNPVHALFRAVWQRYPNADVVAQADKHVHAYSIVPYGIEECLAGRRQSPYVHLIQIGTAKGGAEPYTMRGWGHSYTGWWWLCLFGREHKIRVTSDFDDVLMWQEASARKG